MVTWKVHESPLGPLGFSLKPVQRTQNSETGPGHVGPSSGLCGELPLGERALPRCVGVIFVVLIIATHTVPVGRLAIPKSRRFLRYFLILHVF